jgi:galactokinase
MIVNTNKRRGLTDSKYNERRAECEKAVEDISKEKPVKNLSELSLAEYNELKYLISDEVVRKRAFHVISENARVLEAIPALKSGNLNRFGELMNESHDSLRYDYEVTGIELDTLVEEARKIPGCIGSRMTGAGFGGCTVSIVHKESVEDFIKTVGRNYSERTGLEPVFYQPEIDDGPKELKINN